MGDIGRVWLQLQNSSFRVKSLRRPRINKLKGSQYGLDKHYLKRISFLVPIILLSAFNL